MLKGINRFKREALRVIADFIIHIQREIEDINMLKKMEWDPGGQYSPSSVSWSS